jgi:urease subunit beta
MPLPERFQFATGDIEINANRKKLKMTVSNTGDRAIQVGSHYHFFEANRALRFDRVATLGMHLDLPAGTAVRFEPGDTHEVQLCEYGGLGFVAGFSGLVQGGLRSTDNRARAIRRLHKLGFQDEGDDDSKSKDDNKSKGDAS